MQFCVFRALLHVLCIVYGDCLSVDDGPHDQMYSSVARIALHEITRVILTAPKARDQLGRALREQYFALLPRTFTSRRA